MDDEGATVICDTFLAMMGKLLCFMSLWEQFSSYMVHHPTSIVVFVSFWIGRFLIFG